MPPEHNYPTLSLHEGPKTARKIDLEQGKLFLEPYGRYFPGFDPLPCGNRRLNGYIESLKYVATRRAVTSLLISFESWFRSDLYGWRLVIL